MPDILPCHARPGEDAPLDHKELVSASEAPPETQWVLASCHSVALLDGEEVGDPLEKTALRAANWRLSKSGRS